MTPRKPRAQPDPTALLWTAAESAAALVTSAASVERERARGALRGVRVAGGPWRYRPADVRAYVEALAADERPARGVEAIPVLARNRRTAG